MAIESPRRLIMGKMVPQPFFSVAFDPILSILAGIEDIHKISQTSLNFGQTGPLTTELALERLKKNPIYLWENGVSMLARSFLIESSSKLLVTRIGIKARSILGQIRPLILELLALK